MKELWGDDNYFNLRSLNLYITRLSNHLKADPTIEIESVRGVGYLLK
ncbi:MAG: winged helix-turn-helix domain-containing protein [Alistipes sp.]|nr:winged helix-turn-helix domain-containing protein [Alistipes sp.]